MDYSILTKYAGTLAEDPGRMRPMTRGEDDVIQMPIYLCSRQMRAFMRDFASDRRFTIWEYREILEDAGVHFPISGLDQLDWDSYDERIVLSIITRIMRAGRMNEKALYDGAASGLLDRCLFRLAELAEEG